MDPTLDNRKLEDGMAGEPSSTNGSDRYDDDKLLEMGNRAFDDSTTFLVNHHKSQIERNLANFASRHPAGSKYYTDAYNFRSRLFRPKTRSAERQKEAATAMAFFSTQNVVAIKPEYPDNPENVRGAAIMHHIVNRRLKDDIPWFKTVIGAFQDAYVVGAVISHQYWDHEVIETEVPVEKKVYNRFTGEYDVVRETETKTETIVDKPAIEIVPIEHFRISPNAKWYDPINTSPYLIEELPMHIVDVQDRMERIDKKTGQPQWKKLTAEEIRKVGHSSGDEVQSIRASREGKGKSDPKEDHTVSVDDHSIVWVRRVIMRLPGKGDYIWYTLGEKTMLSKPKPLKDAYSHGRRPYAMGSVTIESHKLIPASMVEIGQDLQAASNDHMNQRNDNIKQVLNKRMLVRRNSQVDMTSLRRNVPGSLTMVGNIDKDIRVLDTGDVTASSFQEQNLLNNDFDEAVGSFSGSSVNTNRQMNETVGGMKMLKENPNVQTEYQMRTLAETWAKEALTQIVLLEKFYETDQNLVAAAGKEAKQEAGPVNLGNIDYKVSVDVGFGVTNPEGRIAKIRMGIETMGMISPEAMQRVDYMNVQNEIFGILGYQSGAQFFRDDEEQKKYVEQHKPGPSLDEQKLMLEREKFNATLEQNRAFKVAEIESKERIEAARLSQTQKKTAASGYLDLKKHDVDVAKVQLEELDLKVKREETLRKDSEIKTQEKPVLNRAEGTV